jgi:glycosyltransferase involved in cell wall biosynthesis
MTAPFFTVCIPAYNRAAVLPELLDSVLDQRFEDFEVLICEDASSERAQIRTIAQRYSDRHPGRLHYHENEKNLGFDANLRRLIERARGRYCLFMGNDDLMCPDALKVIAGAISRHPKIGVFLRSYAAFDGLPSNVVQTFRYFDREIFFPAGAEAISTVFRRSVVIPGVTLNREAALQFATDRFDGTLLYQIYLVANILVEWNGVFSPEIVTLYRNGGIPDFGNSPSEQGRFVPRTRTVESSVHFMRGMLEIARDVEATRHVEVYQRILSDIANYSYPVLAFQAEKPFRQFFGYYRELIKLGFGRHFLFHAYFLSILLFGTRRLEQLFAWIKRRIGHTPVLGTVYTGDGK